MHRLRLALAFGPPALWLLYALLELALSGRLAVWTYASLMPPIAFAIVPFLLAALIPVAPRGRRWYAAGLCALTLTAGAITGTGINVHAFGKQPVAPPDAIKVVSWNTEYWYLSDNGGVFYDYLKAQHADVYLLQGHMAPDESAPSGASGRDDDEWLGHVFPGFFIAHLGDLITISRYPIVARPRVGPAAALPATPATAADWQREYALGKILRTDIAVGGRTVSFYNVHLAEPLGPGVTLVSARVQIAALHDDVARNPAPVLIGGDFNTSPSMGGLGPVRAVATDAITVNRDLYPASWHTDLLPLWRLDWMFTAHGLVPRTYTFRDPEHLSNHRLQSVAVTLP